MRPAQPANRRHLTAPAFDFADAVLPSLIGWVAPAGAIRSEDEASSRFEWVQDWQQVEFFLAPTHINCDRALNGKVIATISRLGVPIGVVKDQRGIMQHYVAREN
jgi:hypothetical protein